MHIVVRISVLLATLAALTFSPLTTHSAPNHPRFLSARDEAVTHVASRLALHHPAQAVNWLRRQPSVRSARLTSDGGAVRVVFRDGLPLILLSPSSGMGRTSAPGLTWFRQASLASLPNAGPTPSKAAVLLPFAGELNEGANAGQAEIDALKKAGFAVDVFRDSAVTIDLMEHLTDYSVVYLETHSDPLGDGDAVVSSASNAATDTQKYCAFLLPAYCRGGDGTVQPVTVDGTSNLYLAIGAGFVQKHMGTFPASSMLYLDGCNLLGANVFWQALQAKNLSTMVSWDNHVYSFSSQQAAQFMFTRLDTGETIQSSLTDAQANGLAIGFGDQGTAHLGYLGDGNLTLAESLAQATPTPTPTATASPTDTPAPTSTPVPVFLKVKLARKKIKVGKKQTVSVTTLPGATVAIKVKFPNHHTKNRTGSANGTGKYSWSFKQPARVTTKHGRTAMVVVHASDGSGDAAVKTTRKYTIS